MYIKISPESTALPPKINSPSITIIAITAGSGPFAAFATITPLSISPPTAPNLSTSRNPHVKRANIDPTLGLALAMGCVGVIALALGGFIWYFLRYPRTRKIETPQPQSPMIRPFNLKYRASMASTQIGSEPPPVAPPPGPSSRPQHWLRASLPPLPTSAPDTITTNRTRRTSRRSRSARRPRQAEDTSDTMIKLRLQIIDEQLSALEHEINSGGYDTNSWEIAMLRAKVLELREQNDGDTRTLVSSSRLPTPIPTPTPTPTPMERGTRSMA